jgi:hypothetical protein
MRTKGRPLVRTLQVAGLALGSLVLCLLVVELTIRGFGLFERERAAVVTAPEPGTPREEQPFTSFQLHPFLSWGPDQETTWTRSDDDAFVIGVFGGSVAANAARAANESFPGLIAGILSIPEDELVVKNFAAHSYKQPQQVIALVQAIMLGMNFDVVVNIDGFNEVAFGGVDCRAGYHPIFPSRKRLWVGLALLQGNLSVESTEAGLEIVRLKERARRIATTAGGPMLGASTFAKAFGGALVLHYQREALRLEEAFQRRLAESHGMERLVPSQPDPRLKSKAGCRELITEMWSRSSVMMSNLADQIGARYVHVLQPNQYVEDSKQLSHEELESAFLPRHRLARNAAAGYPYLQREGRKLVAQGIEFHDLTGIFRDERQTIYTGICCHMNLEGRRALLTEIAEILRSTP